MDVNNVTAPNQFEQNNMLPEKYISFRKFLTNKNISYYLQMYLFGLILTVVNTHNANKPSTDELLSYLQYHINLQNIKIQSKNVKYYAFFRSICWIWGLQRHCNDIKWIISSRKLFDKVTLPMQRGMSSDEI